MKTVAKHGSVPYTPTESWLYRLGALFSCGLVQSIIYFRCYCFILSHCFILFYIQSFLKTVYCCKFKMCWHCIVCVSHKLSHATIFVEDLSTLEVVKIGCPGKFNTKISPQVSYIQNKLDKFGI